MERQVPLHSEDTVMNATYAPKCSCICTLSALLIVRTYALFQCSRKILWTLNVVVVISAVVVIVRTTKPALVFRDRL